MASGPGWRRLAAVASSPTAVPRAASACRPDEGGALVPAEAAATDIPASGVPKGAVGRLKQRRDFLRVAAHQRKWATPGLILQAAPMPEADRSAPGRRPAVRVGFTVSRKVGNAVQRNRARRRLKAAAAEILPALAAPGTDYVVIGRKGTLDRSYEALLNDLRTAVKRVGTDRAAVQGQPAGPAKRRRGPRPPRPSETSAHPSTKADDR